MTDPLAGQVPEADASADIPPVAPALDIEALKAQLKQEMASEFDQRVAGFQRALNEKEKALQAAQEKAREAEMAGLSQDERDALVWNQTEQELARLRAENALLALQGEYPDEMPVFKTILGGESPKDQLEALRAAIAAARAASQPQTPAAEPEPEIPPVDLNNPMSRPQYNADAPTFNGQPINEEWADRVLDQFGRR